MLNYAAIGKKIRQLRKSRELSQEQLAEQVWISVTHMSHIETGNTKLSLPVFVDIANTSFNNNPEQIECVIVDKTISGTGYRQITQYNLYVIINGQKVAIDVSSDLYKAKEVDDTLIVHYYKGNLNLPYYESGETL